MFRLLLGLLAIPLYLLAGIIVFAVLGFVDICKTIVLIVDLWFEDFLEKKED